MDIFHVQHMIMKAITVETLITKAHSFPRKIPPNSVGQLWKFHSSPWKNRPNFLAHRSLPFEVSCLLFSY